MTDYQFVPFEFPKSRDGEYMLGLDDAGVLISRRMQLGFTQEQVADMAGIQLSQYQRFESGKRSISNCAMRTGLAICAVLLLDPYEMVGVNVDQSDPRLVKPQQTFDAGIPDEFPKRVGRKQIRRDIMKVFLNYEDYSILVPYEVLDRIGSPDYIQLLWNMDERRIVIKAAAEKDKEPIDVPTKIFDQSLLALPALIGDDNPISAMKWGETVYSVEARLVQDRIGQPLILIDLNTAKETTDLKEVKGVYMVPNCFRAEDDDDEM